MANRSIRGRITGFRKEGHDAETPSSETKVILEVETDSFCDATLLALVIAQPEAEISIIDELEKDR